MSEESEEDRNEGDERPEPLMAADPSRLREVRPSELALRFAFGAAISVIAGIISKVFGPRAGGMFLAFPAILPATLTLLEKKEGRHEVVQDVAGTVPGAVGLVAFALVVWGLERRGLPLRLSLALVAWTTVAVGSYLLWAWWRKRGSGPLEA